MTAQIVDDLTDTTSDKNRECVGQGVANIATGFIGGMAGCAMIGQSVINVKSGGRGRLSTFCAGIFLLFLIVVLGAWVKQIPMPALVAVMIMVSIGTFSWVSIRNLQTPSALLEHRDAGHRGRRGLHAQPRRSASLVGVLLSGIFFAWKIAQLFRVDLGRRRRRRDRGPTRSKASSSSPRPRTSPPPSTSRRRSRRSRSTSAAPISGTSPALPRSTWSC